MTDFSIGPARRDELPRILGLLEEAGLPPDGLEDRLSTTLVARRDGQIGERSRLTEAALALSRRVGAEEAYLLTETADLFFPRFGFRTIPRSEVPESVRRSVEFTSACPTSARAMALDLRAA